MDSGYCVNLKHFVARDDLLYPTQYAESETIVQAFYYYGVI